MFTQRPTFPARREESYGKVLYEWKQMLGSKSGVFRVGKNDGTKSTWYIISRSSTEQSEEYFLRTWFYAIHYRISRKTPSGRNDRKGKEIANNTNQIIQSLKLISKVSELFIFLPDMRRPWKSYDLGRRKRNKLTAGRKV